MEEDYSTLYPADGYSTKITDVISEVTEDYLRTTEITATMEDTTGIYSIITEITSEFFNVTDDYLNNTDTGESLSCEYQPWPVVIITIEDFVEKMVPFFDSGSLYNLVPAGLSIFLLIIGVLGNFVNIFVYTRRVMRTPISILLAILELINLFVFLTFIPGLIRHYSPEWQVTFNHAIFDLVDLVAENSVICCSNWLTVLVGIWRYVAINWPLSVERFCGWTRTKIIILVIAVISILISIPPAFLKTYEQIQFNITYKSNTSEEYSEIRIIYSVIDTELSCLKPNFVKFSDGLVLLATVIPCICLAIVTCLLLRSVWAANTKRRVLIGTGPSSPSRLTPQCSIPYNRNETSRETRLTILLAILVFLYFLAYLPDTVINIYQLTPEGTENITETTFYNVTRTRISILICNSATFFIYFLMSERYRETLKKNLPLSDFAKDFSKKSSSLQQSMSNSKTVSLKDLSVTTNV